MFSLLTKFLLSDAGFVGRNIHKTSFPIFSLKAAKNSSKGLEKTLLEAIAAEHRSAKQASWTIRKFLSLVHTGGSPFDKIKTLIAVGKLDLALKLSKFWPYSRNSKLFRQLVYLPIDLSTITVSQLEYLVGIGPKTARYFILYTRPNSRVAVLDVHILKWLRGLGYNAPKFTPQDPVEYLRLENIFLQEAARRGETAGSMDEKVWTYYHYKWLNRKLQKRRKE